MKLSSIFAAGTWLAGVFVQAAPTVGSAAANIVKRNEAGYDVIDFDYVIKTIREINQRYANNNANTLKKRDDSEFIDQLMMELHNHDMLEEFLQQMSTTERLKPSVQQGMMSAISSGKVDETSMLTSLRNSGKLSKFFDYALNDESLNDKLYFSARDILQKAQNNHEFTTRALTESGSFFKTLYADMPASRAKRGFSDESIVQAKYGMSKRDLISTIVSVVEEIYDSGLVQDIIDSIIGNQSLVSYVLGLLEDLLSDLFGSIDWSSLWDSFKNSGLIESLLSTLLSFLSSLFSGDTLSSLIDELFGDDSNSTHKSFLATLLSLGIELGEDLFSSLTSSDGLLSDLLDSFLNSTDSSSSSSSGSSSSSLSSILSSLLSSLFGSSSDDDSSSDSSSSDSSGSGLLSSLFDLIFGDDDSDDSSSSSSSSSTSLSSIISSLVDSLFGGSSSSSGTATSTTASSASSSAFESKYSCCCSSSKIKKRAMKRALKKKMRKSVKRSVKRTLMFESPVVQDGLMNFFYFS